ncbi:DNA polymerase III subunit delta [Mycoplasma iguanae]|uniref:DNA polymerase III subunit delta n=1 Tax=Mycoplasma iguanae TaxID=292461 RepID=A0ABY5RB97_9MOLU|nr:DNA polymerase III subunit delta [Mycoplasma iguanae]UVD81490.1 DNA polymerase III subunit delta [Mycoplasma iguanae]
MYLIHGEDSFLIKSELKKIIKKNDQNQVVYFDFDASIEDIVNAVSSVSLFDEQKLVVWKNSPWLITNKENDKKAMKNFITFLENSQPLIIFYVEQKITKSANELIKFLFKNAKVSEIKTPDEKTTIGYIQKIAESLGGKISYSNAVSLYYQLGKTNLELIANEIAKILQESKNIDINLIEKSISHYDVENDFEFSNAINSLNIKNLWKIYETKNNENIIFLIGQFSQILILASKIYTYQKAGFNKEQIEKQLNIHAYRIKLATDFLNNLGIEKIINSISKLSSLDLSIKKGEVEEQIGFENFLLSFIK